MKLHTESTGLNPDPLEVFKGLVGQHKYCFLLETLGGKDQPHDSGQSYIGVDPAHHFAALNGRFYIDGKEKPSDNPYKSLRSHIKFQETLPAHYVGGLVGYLSHEAIQYAEPELKFSYKRDFFDFEFGQYDDGLVFRRGQAPEYFYYGQDRLKLYQPSAITSAKLKIDFTGSAKTKSQYFEMVSRARDDVINGRVFQVVLANKYEYGFDGELFELYKQLRQINPASFMFFIKFGDIVTMGASPELLTHTMPTGRTYLEALAGTIKRGKTSEEDVLLSRHLLHDEKEIAEHNMMVDLYRNDVGRVSQIGSVRIDKLKYIRQTSHVQHICSLISGQLEAGKDAFDAMAAAFPAGTLVGAPKIEAAKMINELEGYERGPFGGSVGYFGYNGDSVHAVNIRSVNAVRNKLVVHSGSGIVYDSRPEQEYQEIGNKKIAMDLAMKPFGGGKVS